jgi:HAD superfamily hydrolase (TIGR01549 family)
VCLDVGETLIDETRVWEVWASVVGAPAHTLAACLGAAIVEQRDHTDLFARLGAHDWRSKEPEAMSRYGSFVATDLYPDALRTIARLRAEGYRIAVIGNQPARRQAELETIGVRPDAMAMSDALGVAKPNPAFFESALRVMGGPTPADVAYVGDRVDNDVGPARTAGLRSVWIRRGPWGVLQDDGGLAHLVVTSLDDLADRIAEAFPS